MKIPLFGGIGEKWVVVAAVADKWIDGRVKSNVYLPLENFARANPFESLLITEENL